MELHPSDILGAANRLLLNVGIDDQPFFSVDELQTNASALLVAVFERLFDCRIPSIERRPRSAADDAANAAALLRAMAAELPAELTLPGGVTGASIAGGDLPSIVFLIALFNDVWRELFASAHLEDAAGALPPPQQRPPPPPYSRGGGNSSGGASSGLADGAARLPPPWETVTNASLDLDLSSGDSEAGATTAGARGGVDPLSSGGKGRVSAALREEEHTAGPSRDPHYTLAASSAAAANDSSHRAGIMGHQSDVTGHRSNVMGQGVPAYPSFSKGSDNGDAAAPHQPRSSPIIDTESNLQEGRAVFGSEADLREGRGRPATAPSGQTLYRLTAAGDGTSSPSGLRGRGNAGSGSAGSGITPYPVDIWADPPPVSSLSDSDEEMEEGGVGREALGPRLQQPERGDRFPTDTGVLAASDGAAAAAATTRISTVAAPLAPFSEAAADAGRKNRVDGGRNDEDTGVASNNAGNDGNIHAEGVVADNTTTSGAHAPTSAAPTSTTPSHRPRRSSSAVRDAAASSAAATSVGAGFGPRGWFAPLMTTAEDAAAAFGEREGGGDGDGRGWGPRRSHPLSSFSGGGGGGSADRKGASSSSTGGAGGSGGGRLHPHHGVGGGVGSGVGAGAFASTRQRAVTAATTLRALREGGGGGGAGGSGNGRRVRGRRGVASSSAGQDMGGAASSHSREGRGDTGGEPGTGMRSRSPRGHMDRGARPYVREQDVSAQWALPEVRSAYRHAEKDDDGGGSSGGVAADTATTTVAGTSRGTSVVGASVVEEGAGETHGASYSHQPHHHRQQHPLKQHQRPRAEPATFVDRQGPISSSSSGNSSGAGIAIDAEYGGVNGLPGDYPTATPAYLYSSGGGGGWGGVLGGLDMSRIRTQRAMLDRIVERGAEEARALQVSGFCVDNL